MEMSYRINVWDMNNLLNKKNTMTKKILVFLAVLLLVLGIGITQGWYSHMAKSTSAKRYAIHTGSYSADRNNLTQAEIDALVLAIVKNIPNAKYIVIGTHMDYALQMRMWADSIHQRGRHVWFRSFGFNSWQGHFGFPATGTPDQHRIDMANFIVTNKDIFAPGDIFSPVPDEPENSSYWTQTYGSPVWTKLAAKEELNYFIQDSILDAQEAFSIIDVPVAVNYVFTNPYISKSVLNATTTSIIAALSTDNYPERVNGVALTSANEMANAMLNEINIWLLPATPGKPKHLTIGPSVWTQLTTTEQTDGYKAELDVIKANIPLLDGITVWQAGSSGNPKSRLFDYENGMWIARPATKVINKFFRQ